LSPFRSGLRPEPLRVRVRVAATALSVLVRAVGLASTIRLLIEAGRRLSRGEPWRGHAAPANAREAFCRERVGEVAVIAGALQRRLGSARGLEVSAELVRESAITQLRALVPRLSPRRYRALSPAGRQRLLRRLVGRFANAHIGVFQASPARFRFTVTRCEYAALCGELGRPELAGLFCAGDGAFFRRHMPGVAFDRPGTIADGGACCDFRLRWRSDAPTDLRSTP
jgi:hypothetical protein